MTEAKEPDPKECRPPPDRPSSLPSNVRFKPGATRPPGLRADSDNTGRSVSSPTPAPALPPPPPRLKLGESVDCSHSLLPPSAAGHPTLCAAPRLSASSEEAPGSTEGRKGGRRAPPG